MDRTGRRRETRRSRRAPLRDRRSVRLMWSLVPGPGSPPPGHVPHHHPSSRKRPPCDRDVTLTRQIDTSTIAPMEARSKRTYRVSQRTQQRVRELASRYGVAGSQDAVVEAAVDRLYREVEANAEANLWAEAATDPEFQAEAAAIARTFDAAEAWPD